MNWKLTVLQEYLHSPKPSDTVYILKPTAAVLNCLQIIRWEKSTDKVKEFLQNKYNIENTIKELKPTKKAFEYIIL